LATYFLELELVQMLVDHGANVNAAQDDQGQTPLHRVLEADLARFSDTDRFGIAQLFVERGADVNARHENDETPLHLASSLVNLRLVQMLVDHGATVDAEDNRGRTPLHRVLEAQGHRPSHRLDRGWVQILLDDLGAIFNVTGGDNSYRDRFGVVQLLVERGADVNTKDNMHEIPLHGASRLLSLEVVWILLKHGADLDAENEAGKTPFQLVRERVREEQPSAYSRSRKAEVVALLGLLCSC
jgi:ankyrin repeat protein